MKQQILIALSLALSTGAFAQSAERQVIGSTGSSFSSASLQVDYTVGETVTASGSSGSFSVNQGFQQNATNGTAIKEQNILVNYGLYPNPAQNEITLTLNTDKALELRISIVNVAGQVMMADEKPSNVAQSYKREFSIQHLASGSYFLNLYDNKNGLLQSIKFIKQ